MASRRDTARGNRDAVAKAPGRNEGFCIASQEPGTKRSSGGAFVRVFAVREPSTKADGERWWDFIPLISR